MKTARLVVLGIAVVAGGGAALLAGRSDAPPAVRESKLINTRGSGYMAAILPAGMRAVSTEISRGGRLHPAQ